jgi:hypothetical protein
VDGGWQSGNKVNDSERQRAVFSVRQWRQVVERAREFYDVTYLLIRATISAISSWRSKVL